jgi:alanine dehydrogenase
LANRGLHRAVKEDPGLLDGVNTHEGRITCQPVAESQERPYHPFELSAS